MNTQTGTTARRTLLHRTANATLDNLAELPISITGLVLVTTGLLLGIGLIPLALIGLPVLSHTLATAHALARWDRRRLRISPLPGASWTTAAPADNGHRAQVRRQIAEPDGWRAVAWLLTRVPLDVVAFTVTVSTWTIGVASVAYPLYHAALPNGGAHLTGTLVLDSTPEVVAVTAAGIVVTVVAVVSTLTMANARTSVARILLTNRTDADQLAPTVGAALGDAT